MKAAAEESEARVLTPSVQGSWACCQQRRSQPGGGARGAPRWLAGGGRARAEHGRALWCAAMQIPGRLSCALHLSRARNNACLCCSLFLPGTRVCLLLAECLFCSVRKASPAAFHDLVLTACLPHNISVPRPALNTQVMRPTSKEGCNRSLLSSPVLLMQRPPRHN